MGCGREQQGDIERQGCRLRFGHRPRTPRSDSGHVQLLNPGPCIDPAAQNVLTFLEACALQVSSVEVERMIVGLETDPNSR